MRKFALTGTVVMGETAANIAQSSRLSPDVSERDTPGDSSWLEEI